LDQQLVLEPLVLLGRLQPAPTLVSIHSLSKLVLLYNLNHIPNRSKRVS